MAQFSSAWVARKLLIRDAFVRQFLPPCLDGETGLALRNDRLLGIGVLDGQMARIAGQKDGLDRSLSSFPNPYYIGDVNEMIPEAMGAVSSLA